MRSTGINVQTLNGLTNKGTRKNIDNQIVCTNVKVALYRGLNILELGSNSYIRCDTNIAYHATAITTFIVAINDPNAPSNSGRLLSLWDGASMFDGSSGADEFPNSYAPAVFGAYYFTSLSNYGGSPYINNTNPNSDPQLLYSAYSENLGPECPISIGVNGTIQTNHIRNPRAIIIKAYSIGAVASYTGGLNKHYIMAKVCEVIVFDYNLRREERNAVERYLRDKWTIPGVNINEYRGGAVVPKIIYETTEDTPKKKKKRTTTETYISNGGGLILSPASYAISEPVIPPSS
jgi:hypothetical protein